MKVFKRLATLSMAVLMALGVGAFVGCKKNNNDSTSETQKTYTCYEFVVVNADGTKVGEGYSVQVCKVDENGNIEKIMPKVKPDTNAPEILAKL